MELTFKILAVILAGVAAYFLWQGNADRAFVSAIFGAVSFFLSVRVQVNKRLKQREAERVAREEEEWRREEEAEEQEEEAATGGPARLTALPAKRQIDDARRPANDQQKI